MHSAQHHVHRDVEQLLLQHHLSLFNTAIPVLSLCPLFSAFLLFLFAESNSIKEHNKIFQIEISHLSTLLKKGMHAINNTH